jgi:hypothetical protein
VDKTPHTLLPVSTQPTPKFVVYDGTDLPSTVFRIVKSDPPGPDSFETYFDQGRSVPSADFFLALGNSMYLNLEAAKAVNGRKRRLGPLYAELDLSARSDIFWCHSRSPDHVTIWAPSALLADHVVNCVS